MTSITGTRKLSKLITRKSCPICSFDYFSPLSDGGSGFNGQAVVMCMTCGHAFHNPYDEAATGSEYESDEYSVSERAADVPTQRFMSESYTKSMERINFCKQYVDFQSLKGTTYFELGSGDGATLRLINDLGLNSIGVELSKGFAEHAAGYYGVDSRFGNGFDVLDESEISNISVIGMFHVIEHLVDPIDTLQKVHHTLSNNGGGYLLLEYPDLLRAIARSNFNPDTYFHRYHVHDFTTRSMGWALWQTGFGVIAQKTWGSFPKDKNMLLACRSDLDTDLITPLLDEDDILLDYLNIKAKIDKSFSRRDWRGTI